VREYGEDSDFVRVRLRGLPPSASELQFIDSARIYAAQKRLVEVLDDEPLIAGFDVSGGGSAWNVTRFRSTPPILILGEAGRESSVLIARAAEVMRGEFAGRRSPVSPRCLSTRRSEHPWSSVCILLVFTT